MHRRLLTAILFAGLAAAAPQPRRLTLRDAESMALSHHPALQSAKALQRAALEVPSRYGPG